MTSPKTDKEFELQETGPDSIDLECLRCKVALPYLLDHGSAAPTIADQKVAALEDAMSTHDCLQVQDMYILVTPVTNHVMTDHNIVGLSEIFNDLDVAREVAAPYGAKVYKLEEA